MNSLIKSLEIEKKAFEFQHNVLNKRSGSSSDLSESQENSNENQSESFNTENDDEEEDYDTEEESHRQPVKDKFFGRRSIKTRGVGIIYINKTYSFRANIFYNQGLKICSKVYDTKSGQ